GAIEPLDRQCHQPEADGARDRDHGPQQKLGAAENIAPEPDKGEPQGNGPERRAEQQEPYGCSFGPLAEYDARDALIGLQQIEADEQHRETERGVERNGTDRREGGHAIEVVRVVDQDDEGGEAAKPTRGERKRLDGRPPTLVSEQCETRAKNCG